MIYDTLSKNKFKEIRHGNIFYELKEKIENMEDKIPYENLIEELQIFLQTLQVKKSDIQEIYGETSSEDLDDMVNDSSFQFNSESVTTDLDKCLALNFNYNENYTLKDLQKIAEYYEISTRKLCKVELVEKIIEYEENFENIVKVTNRKKLWNYMKAIKKDKYLKSFLIFDSPIISK